MTRLLLILMMVGVWSGVWGEEIKIHTEKYENGKVKVKGNLVDGKQEGKWVIYDENGKMKKEESFHVHEHRLRVELNFHFILTLTRVPQTQRFGTF